MAESLEYLPVENLRVENVERRWHLGREYLLAPIASIVPGVLNGSRGSLFYPEEQVNSNVQSWDGMPLTKSHPQGGKGQHLSAKDEGVWERQGLGVVRDSVYDGKLRHTGWFDAERTRQLAPKTYDALLTGQPVEISTGLFTNNDPAPPGANHNGKSYDYVATSYRPDHIAILENEVGACSIADGCGLNVTNAAAPVQNAKDAKGHGSEKHGEIGSQINEHFGHLFGGHGEGRRAYVHKVELEDKLVHVQPLATIGPVPDDVQRGHNNVKMTQAAADDFERANPEWSVIVRDPKATHNASPIQNSKPDGCVT